jgi:serpin B
MSQFEFFPDLENVGLRAGRPVRTVLHPRLLSAGVSFGLELYRQLTRQNPLENLVISPVTIALTLAMATNGARGRTRESMATVLGIDNMNIKEWNEGYKDIVHALRLSGEQGQLQLSNSVWLDEQYPASPEFVSNCKTCYGAEVVNISFASEGAAMRINRWVSEHTGWKIREIIANIDSLDRMLLLNAAYFRGHWSRTFDPDQTSQGMFHAASGARMHPMMRQKGDYGYFETDEFQAVILPYGFRTALYLFLPSRARSLSALLENVTAAMWDNWMASFRTRPGEVVVPRFRVEHAVDLRDALRALGMSDPFERDRADFSRMSPEAGGLFASGLRQLTLLDVNELGTECAAATSMMFTRRGLRKPSPSFLMVLDRPFLLAIRDQVSGLLLFMGSVLEP